MSPVSEVSFTGPVDGALDPVRAVQLVQTLREAVETISPHSAPSRVAVTTSESTCTAEIETAGPVPDCDLKPTWLAQLSDSSAEAGFILTVQPAPGGTRFTWSVPFDTCDPQPTKPELAAAAGQAEPARRGHCPPAPLRRALR